MTDPEWASRIGATGSGQTNLRRVLAAALLVPGALLLSLSTLLVSGALIPQIPYVGAVGSQVWPTWIGLALIVVLVGLLLVLAAAWLVPRRTATVFAALGCVALAGTLVILISQIQAAIDAGVPISPSALLPGARPHASPDDSVTYATDTAGEPLSMDIYLPTIDEPDESVPIVMYVHGGGWRQGSPDEASAVLRWFADQGYLVVAPEYTLATADRATWDVAMPQIGCALVWAALHAADYGADPTRVAVWGGSAGANLSLATTYAAAADALTLPCDGELPRVSAVAGEVPAVDLVSIYRNPDPLYGAQAREMVIWYIGGTIEEQADRVAAVQVASYLSPDAPPTLLMVSRGDHLVPVRGTTSFVDQALAAGVDIEAVYRPWGDHIAASDYGGLTSQTMMRLLLEHFRNHGV